MVQELFAAQPGYGGDPSDPGQAMSDYSGYGGDSGGVSWDNDESNNYGQPFAKGGAVKIDIKEQPHAMPDGSFPIRNMGDLRLAVRAHHKANDKAAAANHIRRRARALGAAHMVPKELA
jgi:hypothetical protein